MEIDPKYPGDQGESVYCFRILSYTKDKMVYEGSEIEMLVDLRDVKENMYSLEVLEGSNQATLTKPVMVATFRKDKDKFEARLGTDTAHVKTANEVARSAYSKIRTDERVKKYTLQWPSNHKLSQKPFGTGSASLEQTNSPQKVPPTLVVYKVDTELKDKHSATIYQLFARIRWSLVDLSSATPLDVADEDGGIETVNKAVQGL